MAKPPTIAFFNNKGGVGKTSLVYHIAWMLADLQYSCLAVDLDPQSNLTAAMLDEAEVEELWANDAEQIQTVFDAIHPQVRGLGDIAEIEGRQISIRLQLLPGDLRLSSYEDKLSDAWPDAVGGDEAAFRTLTAFYRMMHQVAAKHQTDYILVDVGPNLGALNRAALIACDYVVVPLAPDLFSLQGLRNLGPTLRRWRDHWQDRRQRKPSTVDFELPEGQMLPIGYVVLQHRVRLNRPAKAYTMWLDRIPSEYATSILASESDDSLDVLDDPNCLGMLKHFASLVPLAQEARKPIFRLNAADGAIGSHYESARRAGDAYREITERIIQRCSHRSQ